MEKTLKKKNEWFARNKVMLKFSFMFFSMVAVLFTAARSEYVLKTFAVWYPEFITDMVGKIISLANTHVSTYGQFVRGDKFSMRIIYDCSGVFATSIYLAAVLAYPAPLKGKLIGCVLGAPFLAAVNIIRLVCMFFVGLYFPKLFHFFHIYLWQGIFIIFVIVTWMFWAELYGKRKN